MRNTPATASAIPNAALSEDGNTVAVVLPSSERRILQVFQVESGLLQTTLNARQSSNLLSNTNNSQSALGSESLEKVIFCGNSYVAALSNSSAAADHQHSQVLIWDLSRGGVVAHSIGGDEWNSSKRYVDAASNGEHLYLLVAVSSSGFNNSSSRRSSASGNVDDDDSGGAAKLQIHQYDPSSGRLMRKIKCGKGGSSAKDSEFGLAVLNDHESGKLQFVIRNGNGAQGSEAFRVLDAETGSKVGKHKYREGKKQAKKDGTGGTGVQAVNTFVVLPRTSTVAVYCLKSSHWMKAIPATNANPMVRVWDAGSEGSVLILVDDKLYHCTTSDGPEEVSKVTMDQSSTVIPRSTKQAAVIMHNPKDARSSYQIQLLDWSPLSSNIEDIQMIGSIPSKIELRWVSDEEAAGGARGGSISKKRNAESITVLGPGQAGRESSGVSERTAKKKLKHSDMDMAGSDDPSMGMSIADRLKQLAEVSDGGDEEEEGGQSSVEKFKKPMTKKDFVAKRATTESLTQLLTQALRGGDDGLLELALSVKDKNILQQTMKGLDSYCIDILLTKLTTRLASKPQRAEELAFWLSYVLESGRVQQMGQLQPLKNLLQDRIDAFPHLLRLEGRLSMVNAEKRRGRKRLAAASLK